MMNNNNKEITKTVFFDIGMLTIKVNITFEDGDFDDEQLEYIARLDFAARQGTCNIDGKDYGNQFFEKADIINYTSTNDVEIYGKKFAFTKFKEELLDENEKRVLNSYMIIKIVPNEFKPIGIVKISSTVDSLDAPFQHHSDSWYEGIEPCTKKDLAEFTILLPTIRFYSMTGRNNLLDLKLVDDINVLEDLTEKEQIECGRALLTAKYVEACPH